MYFCIVLMYRKNSLFIIVVGTVCPVPHWALIPCHALCVHSHTNHVIPHHVHWGPEGPRALHYTWKVVSTICQHTPNTKRIALHFFMLYSVCWIIDAVCIGCQRSPRSNCLISKEMLHGCLMDVGLREFVMAGGCTVHYTAMEKN